MLEFTRQELESEIAEKQADLQTLTAARDLLWNRCVEVRDNSKSRLSPFNEWAGTHALMNSLDVFINNATRLVDELKETLSGIPPEPPRLKLVRNEEQ